MMHRFLTTFRVVFSNKPKSADISFSIKKYPILLACLSSGILYQSYRTLPKYDQSAARSNIYLKRTALSHLFLSGKENNSDDAVNRLRMNRLLDLHQAVETELPRFFDKSTFDFVEKLLDPNTVVYFENNNGLVYTLRNKLSINSALVASRIYYITRSSDRQVELLSLLSDTENWEVEVCVRISYLPRSMPTTGSSTSLPGHAMNLSKQMKMVSFRIIFSLSESGEISSVKVTQILPPIKPPVRMYLNKLAFWKKLGPVLPTGKRISYSSSMSFSQFDKPNDLFVDFCRLKQVPSYPVYLFNCSLIESQLTLEQLIVFLTRSGDDHADFDRLLDKFYLSSKNSVNYKMYRLEDYNRQSNDVLLLSKNSSLLELLDLFQPYNDASLNHLSENALSIHTFNLNHDKSQFGSLNNFLSNYELFFVHNLPSEYSSPALL